MVFTEPDYFFGLDQEKLINPAYTTPKSNICAHLWTEVHPGIDLRFAANSREGMDLTIGERYNQAHTKNGTL